MNLAADALQSLAKRNEQLLLLDTNQTVSLYGASLNEK